ncbi:hypothetical protein GCM10022403_078940 [Streptomyces coacervatus]|uniref:Aminoglycoside phosphotransferase domain-containing protein n=1 Tax=Streptomyces coacervatus TaxID=647381 RepID=A0ABP7J418_9ACTN|nr:hypothetical protein [Streptomyces coacervatus]MDF2269288.1 hypothetical protein [Streptomyces coacervatus]
MLGFDVVEGGRMPSAPWKTDDLNVTLAAYAVTAEALAVPSVELQQVGLKPVGDGGDFDDWRTLAAGTLDPTLSVPGWMPFDKLGALAELESVLGSAVAGTAVLHHDLRQDNVLIDTSNGACSATGTGRASEPVGSTSSSSWPPHSLTATTPRPCSRHIPPPSGSPTSNSTPPSPRFLASSWPPVHSPRRTGHRTFASIRHGAAKSLCDGWPTGAAGRSDSKLPNIRTARNTTCS